MSEHDFTPLYDQYPAIIAQMPAEFTSHQFISKLAQQNQMLYVEALHAYRDGNPFQVVHGILAKGLHRFPDLVTYVSEDSGSKDIFGQVNTAAVWRRVSV